MKAFPKHLVILGGGTAGWLAAAYLDRIYNTPARHGLPITVVESGEIGRIGVGEATLPSLAGVFSFLGLNEADVIRRTHATLKQGVRFEDWSEVGQSYFHPFEAFSGFGQIPVGALWLARKARGVAGRFQDESGIQSRMAEANFSPKGMMDDGFKGPLVYAYHLDADRLGELLAEVAQERGCQRIIAEITRVEQNAEGDIACLHTSDGRAIEGDFFIDCSGFASLLLGQTLKEPYVDFSKHLICDRAVTIRAPYPAQARIKPYTTAKALDAGWMWRIGLRSREGLGYVYSSKHISPQDAEAELRRVSGVPADVPARHLSMKVGHYRNAWVGNCVAIGLAGGFIEPLESTGIYFITTAVNLLVRYFPVNGLNPSSQKAFNRHLNKRYEEIRDFVVAHYCVSKRHDTSFWREVTKPSAIPASLTDRLRIWDDRPPSEEDTYDKLALFSHQNWQYVLYGMGYTTKAAMDGAAFWLGDRDDHIAIFDNALKEASAGLPQHDFWLSGLDPIEADDG